MTPFGTTRDGHEVHALSLAAGELNVTLLTYGAIVQSVRLSGVPHDLTMGSDRIADYETAMPYNGALIGPVANRISGASAEIDGRRYRFEANQGGRHTLHCGSTGFQTRIWSVLDHGRAHATLGLHAPDGLGGFPGNREITARFELVAPATLTLSLHATTDAPTLMNLANHSYWSLDGAPTWEGHSLGIAADHVLTCDDEVIPTGEIRPVAGTPFDFRRPVRLAPGAPALDHNFCLARARGPLREAARLTGASGLSMTLATTEPGLQIYDGRLPVRPGSPPYGALAIEAQGWPDAPNRPEFPSVLLTPEARYSQRTEWRFTRR